MGQPNQGDDGGVLLERRGKGWGGSVAPVMPPC